MKQAPETNHDAPCTQVLTPVIDWENIAAEEDELAPHLPVFITSSGTCSRCRGSTGSTPTADDSSTAGTPTDDSSTNWPRSLPPAAAASPTAGGDQVDLSVASHTAPAAVLGFLTAVLTSVF